MVIAPAEGETPEEARRRYFAEHPDQSEADVTLLVPVLRQVPPSVEMVDVTKLSTETIKQILQELDS